MIQIVVQLSEDSKVMAVIPNIIDIRRPCNFPNATQHLLAKTITPRDVSQMNSSPEEGSVYYDIKERAGM